MKIGFIVLLLTGVFALTACNADETPHIPTIAPETQNTQGQIPEVAPPSEIGSTQHAHTAHTFSGTISQGHFIDSSNNLRRRDGGAFVLGDVEEIFTDRHGNLVLRHMNGAIVFFNRYSHSSNPFLHPYHDDMEIQNVFRFDSGGSRDFYVLDNQGRLWLFPAEELSFSGVEHSLRRTSLLYEAVHGRTLHQPTYEEFRYRFDTYGYFRVADPFVILENVMTMNRAHRNVMNHADFLVLTNDGYNYLINTPGMLQVLRIFPELFDRGSDMFMDFGSTQPPIVRLPFRNLVHVEYYFSGGQGFYSRIELDINGNVHVYGHSDIGDGHGRTDMPRRADNILSNVVQVGILRINIYVALTGEGNLYLWGAGTIHSTPTRMLGRVATTKNKENMIE